MYIASLQFYDLVAIVSIDKMLVFFIHFLKLFGKQRWPVIGVRYSSILYAEMFFLPCKKKLGSILV